MSERGLPEELLQDDGGTGEDGDGDVTVHRANHRMGESNDIPDDHIILSQRDEGAVEVVETKPGYQCEECGGVFETEEERNGHMSSHSGD